MSTPVIERRQDRRYPIHLAVTFAQSARRRAAPGTGYTLDISRRAVLFETDDRIRTGAKLNLVIELPTPSRQGVQNRLRVSGSVIRAVGTQIAVRFDSYKFLHFEHNETEPSASRQCIVCVSSEDAGAICKVLEDRSYNVFRTNITRATSLVRMWAAAFAFVVTDEVEPFKGIDLPLVWANAPAGAAESMGHTGRKLVILENDYSFRRLLNAIDQVTECAEAQAAPQ
jgi:hypothetical protein